MWVSGKFGAAAGGSRPEGVCGDEVQVEVVIGANASH